MWCLVEVSLLIYEQLPDYLRCKVLSLVGVKEVLGSRKLG